MSGPVDTTSPWGSDFVLPDVKVEWPPEKPGEDYKAIVAREFTAKIVWNKAKEPYDRGKVLPETKRNWVIGPSIWDDPEAFAKYEKASMEAQKKCLLPATKAAEDVVVDGFVLLEVKDVAAKDVVVEDEFILM